MQGRRRTSLADRAVRSLAAASVAGVIGGVLVGGIGARLAMALLARQNPEDAGRSTDDGFTVGRFTLEGTVHLMGAALQAALIGAVAYLALRPFVPRGLARTVTAVLLGTVVAGSFLVRADGADFRMLEPTWLPVVLFLAVPAGYVLVLALLTERWLRRGSWFVGAPLPLVAAVLLVWVLSGPLLLLLLVALVAGVAWERLVVGGARETRTATLWAGRAMVTVVGTWALVALASDVFALS